MFEYFPQIEIYDNKVYVEGAPEPLFKLNTDQIKDSLVYQGCEMCEFTGVDLIEYANGKMKPCRNCYNAIEVLKLYEDADQDFWIDRIKKIKARWCGQQRTLDTINTVVIHRLARGRGEAGPRYVSKKWLDREVSWHFTVHHEGFKRPITQHLPINRVGWHSGNRKINKTSIGIELDAAIDGDPHGKYDDGPINELVKLVLSLKALCPNLTQARGHCDIAPGRRVDPGRKFPWNDFLNEVDLIRP